MKAVPLAAVDEAGHYSDYPCLDGPGGIDFDPLIDRINLTDSRFGSDPPQGRILSTNADGGGPVTLVSENGGFGPIRLDTPLGGGAPVPALSYAGAAALMLALLGAAAFVRARYRTLRQE